MDGSSPIHQKWHVLSEIIHISGSSWPSIYGQKGEEKGTPVSFIFLAGESYQCSSQSSSRNCNYSFVYQRRRVFTPDIVSGEMRYSVLGNCRLQAGCSHTANAEHSFSLQCSCSNLPVFPKAIAVFSVFIAFKSLSVMTKSTKVDSSELSLISAI